VGRHSWFVLAAGVTPRGQTFLVLFYFVWLGYSTPAEILGFVWALHVANILGLVWSGYFTPAEILGFV